MMIDSAGSNEVNLTGDTLDDEQVPAETPVRWSPDGTRLAVVGYDGRLYLLQADGSGVEQVDLPGGATGQPAWAPGSR